MARFFCLGLLVVLIELVEICYEVQCFNLEDPSAGSGTGAYKYKIKQSIFR